MLVNLCSIFCRLRTVFWRGRLHQLMVLYFLLKRHIFDTSYVVQRKSCIHIYFGYIENWRYFINWKVSIIRKKKSFIQYMPFAIFWKYSAGCLGNYIFETAQRNCKKPLSPSFTVETFHKAPPFEGLDRETNSKVWRIFLVFGDFGWIFIKTKLIESRLWGVFPKTSKNQISTHDSPLP